MQQLARVAEFLVENPDRNVLIEGHTDSTAPDAYNLALSQRRANAVEDFLITQGVDPTRMSSDGYGEQLPIASNDTTAGRQANRRVELVVLDAGEPIPPPARSSVIGPEPTDSRRPHESSRTITVELADEVRSSAKRPIAR